MVALQEDVPVICGAIHGSQDWKIGNFAPVSIAWGEPMRFAGAGARHGQGLSGRPPLRITLERRSCASALGLAP